MDEQNITTYKAYWPFYVSQHRRKANRNLHFAGTVLVLLFAFLGATQSAWFFLGMPVAGYGLAWLGHYFFERNTPATFRYPFWSLIADFQMFLFMCLGRMDREVRRMGVLTTEF
jgi:hypothetical protein